MLETSVGLDVESTADSSIDSIGFSVDSDEASVFDSSVEEVEGSSVDTSDDSLTPMDEDSVAEDSEDVVVMSVDEDVLNGSSVLKDDSVDSGNMGESVGTITVGGVLMSSGVMVVPELHS